MIFYGILGYCIVVLAMIRPLAGHFAYTFMRNHNQRRPSWRTTRPSPDQWFGAVCLAACLACVWPLCIVWKGVGGRWQIGAEREHVIAVQRKRLAELERELDLT